MNTERQRIAIARIHLGFEDFDWLLWCDEDPVKWEGRKLHGAKRADDDWHEVPNYPADLNAMHEAEKVLTDEQWLDYARYLCDVLGVDHVKVRWWLVVNVMHATAAQRAEAFLRTIGKWEE